MRHNLLLASLAFLPHLVSCGGGGGGGGGGDFLPAASVTYPSSGSVTDSDTITIAGRTAPGAGITMVRVDGVDAQSSDGYETWTAEVQLGVGANRPQVEAETSDGEVIDASLVVIVRRPQVIEAATSLAVDPVARLAYVYDDDDDLIVAVPLAGGDPQVVSSLSIGSGARLEDVTAMTIAPNGDTLYVLESNRILRVDLQTGDRTSQQTGLFTGGTSIAVDVDETTLYMAGNAGLYEIPFATGAAVLLSDKNDATQGDPIDFIRDLVVDPADGAILVVDKTSIVEVDPVSGVRVELSGPNRGAGPSLPREARMTLDPKSGDLFLVEAFVVPSFKGILRVDRTSGDREVAVETGRHPELEDIAFDPVDGRLIVVDSVLDTALSIDPAAGDEATTLFETGLGAGPPLLEPFGLTNTDEALYVVDLGNDSLLRVDRRTGSRETVSGAGVGSGTEIDNPIRPAVDEENGRVYLTCRAGILEIDLSTGNRTLLSAVSAATPMSRPWGIEILSEDELLVTDYTGGGIYEVSRTTGQQTPLSVVGDGKGDNDFTVYDLVIDAANGRALVSGSDYITAVDLTSGVRTKLTDGSAPAFNGDPMSSAFFLALDPEGGRLLVNDVRGEQVVAVDLEDGFRTIVAGQLNGRGLSLADAFGLALDPERDQVLTTSSGSNSVIGIGLAGGDTVLVSK